MGVLLFDKNADFSANSLGHAGLYTSVTTNLLGLFELRRSAAKARQNSAPAYDTTVSLTAGVAYNATSVDFDAVGEAAFPTGPANGGENTVAMIVKVKNSGGSGDSPIGSIPASVTANGACYFIHWNRRLQFDTTLFNAQTGTPTYVANASAYLDAPGDGSLDGTFQLVVATLKSEDALKFYWPARNSVATTAIAAGRFAYFNQSVANRIWRGNGSNTTQQGVSMFAHWDRVLTAGEVATFYSEMKEQFGLIGLTI